MIRIEWSVHALSDLKAISEHIERDRSLETANRVTRKIYDTVQSLRTLPYRGRYGRVADTRELILPQLPYLIVYRVFKEHLVILNILHGAQKWP